MLEKCNLPAPTNCLFVGDESVCRSEGFQGGIPNTVFLLTPFLNWRGSCCCRSQKTQLIFRDLWREVLASPSLFSFVSIPSCAALLREQGRAWPSSIALLEHKGQGKTNRSEDKDSVLIFYRHVHMLSLSKCCCFLIINPYLTRVSAIVMTESCISKWSAELFRKDTLARAVLTFLFKRKRLQL